MDGLGLRVEVGVLSAFGLGGLEPAEGGAGGGGRVVDGEVQVGALGGRAGEGDGERGAEGLVRGRDGVL